MKRIYRKIWLKYFLTYLGIALLVMLILIPIYMIAYRQTRQLVIQETSASLQKNIDNLEMDMLSLNSYVSDTISSEESVRIAYLEDKNNYHMTLALSLSDRLLKTAGKYHGVDDIIILFPNGKYVVSRGKVTLSDRYYDNILGFENYARDDFENKLFKERISFFPVQEIKTGYYIKPVRAISFNYFGKTQKNTYVAICAIITEDHLLNTLLCNSIQQNGYLQLYNAKDEPLMTYGDDTAGPYHQMTLRSQSGYYSIKCGIPVAYIANSVRGIGQTIAAICLLALGASIALSFLLGTRDYRPLHDYLEYVQNTVGDGDLVIEQKSIGGIVNRSIGFLEKWNQSLSDQVNSLREQSRNMLFMDIVNGIHVSEKEQELIKSELECINDHYVIVRILINGNEIPMTDDLILWGNIRETFENHIPDSCFVGNNVNAFLVPVDIMAPESVYSALNRIITEIRQIENEDICLVVGGIHTGIEELRNAYQEVTILIQHYRVKEPEMNLIRYDKLPPSNGESEKALIHAEDLLTILRPDNETYISDWLDRYISQIYSLMFIDFQKAQMQYYSLLSILNQYIGKWNISSGFITLERNTNIEELTGRLKKCIYEILQRMREARDTSNEKTKIIEYIDENYCSPDMCLGKLAGYFDLSETYISRQIKTCTGMTYSAYVETLRMKKAVELIKTQNIPIKNIAEKLGYDNLNTFMKAFKRYYHISPTQMREQ